MSVGFKFIVKYVGNHAVVKGNPHWIVYNVTCENLLLLRFDATKMAFESVDLPEVGKEGKMLFVNWKGSLGGLECVKRIDGILMWVDVWVYDEGLKTWGRTARLGAEGLCGLPVHSCASYNWRKGKMTGLCVDGILFEFDLEMESLNLHGLSDGWDGRCRLITHEESLAHVDGMEAMGFAAENAVAFRDCVLDGFLTYRLGLPSASSLQILYTSSS